MKVTKRRNVLANWLDIGEEKFLRTYGLGGIEWYVQIGENLHPVKSEAEVHLENAFWEYRKKADA